jgi:hypothetical protein
LPIIDLSGEMEYDVMYQTGTVFEFDEGRKGYEKQIKLFLNRLMEESKAHFPTFG